LEGLQGSWVVASSEKTTLSLPTLINPGEGTSSIHYYHGIVWPAGNAFEQVSACALFFPLPTGAALIDSWLWQHVFSSIQPAHR
jgi:hypothetical protein